MYWINCRKLQIEAYGPLPQRDFQAKRAQLALHDVVIVRRRRRRHELWSSAIFLETTSDSKLQVYQIVSSYSLHILARNDVTSCFRSVVSRNNMRIFGRICAVISQ